MNPPQATLTPLDPAIEADIVKFEEMLALYHADQLDPDVFRVFRLNNGIYGQRQGGTNHMVRVKVPYGSMTADQLDLLGAVVEEHSRGWGHITTRQNLQFHFVQLDDIPLVMRKLATVGLSTREACGDTVRNVQGCHLAGACPYEVLDISAWAEAVHQHFLRNPLAQRMPRKFKINFSGCDTDCGQAMFNDVGVIAAKRTAEDGQIEHGFRVFVAGGLGTTPFAALALEEFTSRQDLLPTIESVLRVFDQTGNRDNKLRARMKWVVEHLGIEEVRKQVFSIRKLLPASATWPGGIPAVVTELGDTPAGQDSDQTPTLIGQGVAVTLGPGTPYDRWVKANVVRGAANGTVSAYAWCELGDITGHQFRALAGVVRKFTGDIRVTNRQNFVLRGLNESQLPELYQDLLTANMAQPGAELVRDVVACPGADTCNLAVTQSRGLAKAIDQALEEAGLADVGGVRINISGCPNSCGQHHTADIGFFGAERRAHGQSAPGYQMLLGGYVGQEQIHFGTKALRLPARNAPQAVVRVMRQFVGERLAAETFRQWIDRVGGVTEITKGLRDLDQFPLPTEGPEFYTDFDETAPYVAEVGDSECAT
ncbi:MAG: nitrite/sulfite reductase [Acidimicrobiales bacterium]|nr:nitrite/sulfite reductase [Acidimicrobiales bacterium]